MFDRKFYGGDTHVTVRQEPHNADKYVKLAAELREKAEAEVRDAVIARFGANNELRIVMVAVERNIAGMTLFTRVIFAINGRKFDFTIESDDIEKIRETVLRCLAESIADEAMRLLVKEIR